MDHVAAQPQPKVFFVPHETHETQNFWNASRIYARPGGGVACLSEVPRALAARDTRGFIQLIRDRATDRLLGARILAPEGSELLMAVALAIRHGITVRDIAGAFHPYLTLSDGIKLAALSFGKEVRKLSCCAA
jgi:hypothetical protein